RLGRKGTCRKRFESGYARTWPRYQTSQRLRERKQGSLGISPPRWKNPGNDSEISCVEKGLSIKRNKSRLLGEGLGKSLYRNQTIRLVPRLPCWRTFFNVGSSKLSLERSRL